MIGAGAGADLATSTILDANRNTRVMRIDTGRTVNLHGLRITGGSLDGNGGGVLNDGALTMTDCTITGNEVSGNNADRPGGGVSSDGPATLTRCQVTGNTADNGGGVHVASSTTTLVRSIVGQNEAADRGGGNFVSIQGGATPRVNDGSLITGNRANSRGGGIRNAGTTEFADSSSSVTGNTAGNAGGGVYRESGSVTLNGAPVTGNNPDNCANPSTVPQCSG